MATHHELRSSAWTIPPQVVAYRGREGISELFSFEVGVVWTSDLPFAPEEAVGDPVTLSIAREGQPTHRWHGLVEQVELVLEEGVSSYWKVTIAPRLRRLAFTEHSRVFTDASIPTILRGVLADEGMPGGSFSLGLTASYPVRDHVCQFRESSLDFVRRLAERDGIHWTFRHDEEEEHLAFVDDSRSAAHAVEQVRYAALAGDGAVAGEALVQFRAKRTTIPRGVRLHDHDPMRPRLAVTGAAKVAAGAGGEVVRWGEHVLSPDEAERYARLRSQEIAAREEVFEGHGVVIGLRPGMLFGLVQHPSLDGDYLVTGLRHRARIGNASATVLAALGMEELTDLGSQYRVDVAAIAGSVRFRPASTTPWPRIAGVVSALVDGPASSPYAQIDDEGRYRLRLHFDEGDTIDGSRSTWVRMLQPHGGSSEGMHFPLRKGTEVAVIFLGGDPDRPFILGVAPNPETPSPVQRSNHTKNVVQTGSRNRLEMEDAAGGQFITLSTPIANSYEHLGAGPKNFVLKTDGRGRITTGGNLDVDVDASKTEDVAGAVIETYDASHTLTVTGAVTETLQTSLTWGIAGPVTTTWLGPMSETIDGHVTETFDATLTTTVTGAITTLTYSGGLRVTVASDVTERFTASQATRVDGPLVLLVGGSVTEHAGSASRHVKGTYYLGVAGTYKVLTPNMVLKAPQYDFIAALAKKFVAQKIKVDATATDIQWLNVGTTDLALSATGLSLSLIRALKLSVVGTNNRLTNGVSKTLAGVKAEVEGVKADKASIFLISGGPKIS